MSHVATVQIEIKDLASLQKACEELGLVFHENKTSFKWYGRWVNDYSAQDAAYRNGIDPKDYGKCKHAIGLKSGQGYEIGVVEKNGHYVLVYDNWQGGQGLEKVTGKGLTKLTQGYVKQVTRKQLLMKGYTAGAVKTMADGTIQMVFTHH